MKHHDLKCWPVPFAEVRAGRKTFEIRDNDRDYQSGDTVTLREWEPLTHTYTGKREGPFTVGTVIPAGEWGFPENLCVFSLLRPSPVVMPEEVREALAKAWRALAKAWRNLTAKTRARPPETLPPSPRLKRGGGVKRMQEKTQREGGEIA